ncbi:MAG: zinc ribbon domain-containing protein [Candidatus Gastranaerophilaceae bacterium]
MSECYCPKCKEAVGEDDIRCPHCNMRLKAVCPVCNTANSFGAEFCEKCGNMLLKYCKACNSVNLPNAKVCRKCHASFDEQILKIEKKPIKSKEDLAAKISHNNDLLHNDNILPEQTKSSISPKENNDIPENDFDLSIQENESDLLIQDGDLSILENNFDEPVQSQDTEETIYDEYSVNEIQEYSDSELNLEEPEQTTKQDNILIEENTEGIDTIADEQNSEEQLDKKDISVRTENFKIINYAPARQIVEEEQEEDILYFDNTQQILEQLLDIIKTPNDTIVVSVCGEEGIGKTTAIRTFTETMAQQGIIPILSECSELIKIAPFGCIRDSFLKLLTLPDMHPDIESFYGEETRQLFVQNFETLTNEEILDFMNFLYPSLKGDFSNIYVQKTKTIALLEKIISSIISKNKSVFIIDNFDMIDSLSFEFINNLIKKGIINSQTKLFVSYRENKSARHYFDEDLAKQNIFETLYLNNLSAEETLNFIKSFANTMTVPTTVSFTVNEKGRGNIFFAEQFLSLLFDVGYLYLEAGIIKYKDKEPLPFIPNNIEEVLQLRFNNIQVIEQKESLLAASILGYKFDKTAFAAVVGKTEQQAGELLQKLTDLMFIQPASDYEYSFRNLVIWSEIFEVAQKDTNFKAICKKVYYVFGQYALSNPTLKAFIAKYLDETDIVIQSWKEVSAVCAYFGDAELYSTALEEILIYSGYKVEDTEITDEQIDIMEKFCKLSYLTNPQKTTEYLTAPIIAAKNSGNYVKVVDLSSYLIKSCYLISDYNGVIETVDLILDSPNSGLSDLDKAIIKSKKLHALFNTGNCEEGINIANNDVLPILEEALSQQNDDELIQTLFTAWFDSSVNLVNLYALQGNSKAVEIAENTAEIIRMNNLEKPEYTVRLNLSKAFALTVVGRIPESAIVLKETEQIEEYNKTDYIVRRNLIYAMNLIFSETTENLKDLLYDFAKYSNDNNDVFGKHIFKMMFAWMIYRSGNWEKSNIIFNDELTYFAKIKTVTGALISWLFIAKSTLALEGSESAEHIAMKALEVAQNPKFSQYHAAIYLQKLIAEINLVKGDIGATKMYLEKAMLTAKQFGLDLAQIELYRTYTKFLEQSMLQSEKKSEFATKADKIYRVAIEISENLKIPNITALIRKEQKALLDYCLENKIAILAK